MQHNGLNVGKCVCYLSLSSSLALSCISIAEVPEANHGEHVCRGGQQAAVHGLFGLGGGPAGGRVGQEALH